MEGVRQWSEPGHRPTSPLFPPPAIARPSSRRKPHRDGTTPPLGGSPPASGVHLTILKPRVQPISSGGDHTTVDLGLGCLTPCMCVRVLACLSARDLARCAAVNSGWRNAMPAVVFAASLMYRRVRLSAPCQGESWLQLQDFVETLTAGNRTSVRPFPSWLSRPSSQVRQAAAIHACSYT